MNLVVGVTGITGLGFEVCRNLREMGKPVRAIARPTANPERVTALRALGVDLVEGDLKDRASLDAACRGIETVVTTATAVMANQPGDSLRSVDLDGQVSLVEAARAAGVSHFVYTSYSGGIDPDKTCALTVAKRTVEQALQRSGMAFTILRPSYFMEAWLTPMVGFDFANAKATIYGGGESPIGWISLQDVARAAALCVDNADARGRTFEMGGPENLSPKQVVETFENVGGRAFQVQQVPEEALRAQRETATDLTQQSFAALMLSYAHGDPIDTREMRRVFPIGLTSVREYAARSLGRSG